MQGARRKLLDRTAKDGVLKYVQTCMAETPRDRGLQAERLSACSQGVQGGHAGREEEAAAPDSQEGWAAVCGGAAWHSSAAEDGPLGLLPAW